MNVNDNRDHDIEEIIQNASFDKQVSSMVLAGTVSNEIPSVDQIVMVILRKHLNVAGKAIFLEINIAEAT